jgi:hypothetical protein
LKESNVAAKYFFTINEVNSFFAPPENYRQEKILTQRRKGAKKTLKDCVAAEFICFLCVFAPLRDISSFSSNRTTTEIRPHGRGFRAMWYV